MAARQTYLFMKGWRSLFIPSFLMASFNIFLSLSDTEKRENMKMFVLWSSQKISMLGYQSKMFTVTQWCVLQSAATHLTLCWQIYSRNAWQRFMDTIRSLQSSCNPMAPASSVVVNHQALFWSCTIVIAWALELAHLNTILKYSLFVRTRSKHSGYTPAMRIVHSFWHDNSKEITNNLCLFSRDTPHKQC